MFSYWCSKFKKKALAQYSARALYIVYAEYL